jgi:hypothetical protein
LRCEFLPCGNHVFGHVTSAVQKDNGGQWAIGLEIPVFLGRGIEIDVLLLDVSVVDGFRSGVGGRVRHHG